MVYGALPTHIRWAIHGFEDQFAGRGSVDPETICDTKGMYLGNMRRENEFLKRILKSTHIMRYFGHDFQRFDDSSYNVIEGFMAQTGCPHGTGTGGSDHGNLGAEFNAEPHVRGVCSMARAASPNSANSQFFICFDDATFLDNQYTAWGKVIEGMENVDKIKRGEPVQDPDSIVSMRVAADVA